MATFRDPPSNTVLYASAEIAKCTLEVRHHHRSKRQSLLCWSFIRWDAVQHRANRLLHGASVLLLLGGSHSPSLTNTWQPAADVMDSVAPAGSLSQLRFVKVSLAAEHSKHNGTPSPGSI